MKTFLKILGLLVLSLVLAVAFFFGLRTYQGHKNLELVDNYMDETHLTEKIVLKKDCIIRKLNSKMIQNILMLCNQLAHLRGY